jgi:hypothetical protein
MSEQTTRRRFVHTMGAIAAAPVLVAGARRGAAPLGPDPIFAIIAAWRAEAKAINEYVGAGDPDGSRYFELTMELFQTVPTTLPGLLAFVEIWQEDAEANEPLPCATESIIAALRNLAGMTKKGIADA